MPHPHRIDFAGAIHLLRLKGRPHAGVFFEGGLRGWGAAPRAWAFLQFLAESVDDCAAHVLGYRLECNAVSLLIQTQRVPVEQIMQRAAGSFGRYWKRTAPVALVAAQRGPFAGRYSTRIIAPEYLPHALRRLHLNSAGPRHSEREGQAVFTSDGAYRGSKLPIAISTRAVFTALADKGLDGTRGYQQFMRESDSRYIAELFEHGSPLNPHIVGNPTFVRLAQDAASHPPRPPSRQRLMAAVAQRLHKSPEELVGDRPLSVLARSMVAWYGLRSGAASLSQVARWFSVSSATVGRGMRYHRRAAPQFFTDPLPGLDDEPDTGPDAHSTD